MGRLVYISDSGQIVDIRRINYYKTEFQVELVDDSTKSFDFDGTEYVEEEDD